MPTQHPLKDETPARYQDKAIDRRQLLKILISAGGAVTASTLLPGKWIKPAVEVGVLPAHAQVSPTDTPTPTRPSPTCYTPTPTPTCYTPTPTPMCYTPTPSLRAPSPNHMPQPSSTPTPEARRSLLERLLAEGRFPQDIARKLG